jgi:hypothetical protein
MLQIVGMLRFKLELDGFNVLDVLIDLLMILNIILWDLGINWLQLGNSRKLFLLKLLLLMLISKLLVNSLRKIPRILMLILINLMMRKRRSSKLNLMKRTKSPSK